MKIAVVSDIHDHIHNLRAVLERLGSVTAALVDTGSGDVDRIEVDGVPA